MAFTTTQPVRFGDIDYARIVYYPSLLHILHIAFEEMFEQHCGMTYAHLMGERGIGFPTVHMECEFLAPLRYGDVLQIAIWVPHLGRTSATFEHLVTVDDPADRRTRARLKRVAVDMATLRPVPIPDDLRTAFAGIAELD